MILSSDHKTPAANGCSIIQTWAFIAMFVFAQSLSGPAHAQGVSERDVDFRAYCQAKHANSSPARQGINHFCRQPGATTGFVLHNIDLAVACRMTTGSSTFRRLGARIICAAGPGPVQTPSEASPAAASGQPAGAPDFARYCRTKYTNATYQKRFRSWGVEYLCRIPGVTSGFVFHNIDMADACRMTRNTREYKITDGNVMCISTPARADTPSPGPKPFPKPGPGPGPGPKQSLAAMKAKEMINKNCRAAGGFGPGIMAAAEKKVREMRQKLAAIPKGGTQLIRNARGGTLFQGYMQTVIVWQCPFFIWKLGGGYSKRQRAAAQRYACMIEKRFLAPIGREMIASGFYRAIAPHEIILAKASAKDMCSSIGKR
jgi:hypothetical protein